MTKKTTTKFFKKTKSVKTTGLRRAQSGKNQLQNKSLQLKSSSEALRFVGVSLSGGKSDKACISIIEYYADQKRIFVSRLFEKIKFDDDLSADQKIVNIIQQHKNGLKVVAFDGPTQLPKCISCTLKCPGYEACREPEIIWLRNFFENINKNKKPKKVFIPYTQRCVDAYWNYSNEDKINVHHALGANMAPMAARALFLKKRLQTESENLVIEVQPHISVHRIGRQIHVPKSQLTNFHHQVDGDEVRKIFLQEFIDKKNIFIYQQDLKSMIENNHAFESMIIAYVGFLSYLNLTEKPPKGFPKSEAWIHVPLQLK